MSATVVMRREDPTSAHPSRGGGHVSLSPLDREILAVMLDGTMKSWRPVHVANRITDRPTTHAVAVRIRIMNKKGLITRIRPANGPANGPGASLYAVNDDGRSALDAA